VMAILLDELYAEVLQLRAGVIVAENGLHHDAGRSLLILRRLIKQCVPLIADSGELCFPFRIVRDELLDEKVAVLAPIFEHERQLASVEVLSELAGRVNARQTFGEALVEWRSEPSLLGVGRKPVVRRAIGRSADS